MTPFVIPVLIALISKIGVYLLTRKTLASTAFISLLVVFAFHNLVEMVITIQFYDGYISASLLRVYYVATLFVLANLCVFSMSVANGNGHKKTDFVVVLLAVVVSVGVVATDHIVAGAVSIGYSVTAVRGDFYFIFQLVAIASALFSVMVLAWRFYKSNDVRVRLKCFYILFALLPVLLVSIVVLTAMQLGLQLNAVMLLPIGSTCFLILIVLSERNHDLINIRHYLLFSKARLAEKKILNIVRNHLRNGSDLQNTKVDIEKALVQYALDDSEGNVAWAAERLNVNRSSLYGMLSRLDIKRDEDT